MDILSAERVIRDAADEITAEVRAKGYEKAAVEFWIGSRKTAVTWMFSGLTNTAICCGWGGDLSEAIAGARSFVASLEDGRAYDAELSAPLFLMSERHAEEELGMPLGPHANHSVAAEF